MLKETTALDGAKESEQTGSRCDLDGQKSPLKILEALSEEFIIAPTTQASKTVEGHLRSEKEVFIEKDVSKCEVSKLSAKCENRNDLKNNSIGIHMESQSSNNDSIEGNGRLDDASKACSNAKKEDIYEYTTVDRSEALLQSIKALDRFQSGCDNENAPSETNQDDSAVKQSNTGNDAIGNIVTDSAVKCNECGVVLGDKYNLPSHIKRVHMNMSNSFTLTACPQCTYRHLSQDKMFMHINDVHYKSIKKEDLNRQDLSAIKPSVFTSDDKTAAFSPLKHKSMPLNSWKKVTNKNEVPDPRKNVDTPSYSPPDNECERVMSKAKDFSCMFCEVRFLKITLLRRHINQKHKANSCPACNFKSASSDELIRHYHTTHLDLAACTLCESFLTQDEFKSHMQVLHAQCTDCHLLFKSQADLQKHNSDNHKFHCGVCEEVLPNKDKLQTHMNNVHSCIIQRSPAPRTGMLTDPDIIQPNSDKIPKNAEGANEAERTASPVKSTHPGKQTEDQDKYDEQANTISHPNGEFTSSRLGNTCSVGASKSSMNRNVPKTEVTRKRSTREKKNKIPITEPTYCKCARSQGKRKMIACDNKSCPIEWFHFKCVGLKTEPKGEWFCPDCRGDMALLLRPKDKLQIAKKSSNLETAKYFGNQGRAVLKRRSPWEEDGSAPMGGEAAIGAERGCANSSSRKSPPEHGESLSLGDKRRRGRPPKKRSPPSSSVTLHHAEGGTTEGTSQSIKVAKVLHMKGEEGVPTVESEDTSTQQDHTYDDISTTDLEQCEKDYGAPIAKRGRGRPPKSPHKPVAVVGYSKDETQENVCNDAPQPMRCYTCASCDFVTSSRTMLRKHGAANHSSEKKKAECGKCGYKGRNNVVLQIHYRTMHSEI